MNLTESQSKRVKFLLSDQWDCEADFDKILAGIESSEELHQYAGNFNWDGGHLELKKVVEHPYCDKATGLMIYFLGRPEWLYKHVSEGKSLIGEQPLRFAFLKEIELMIARNKFKSSRFQFSPADVNGRGNINSLNRAGIELVPDFMKVPIAGEPLRVMPMW